MDEIIQSDLKEFRDEIDLAFLVFVLLVRIENLSASSENDRKGKNYTQSLIEFANASIGAKSSTCFARIRILRLGGYIREKHEVQLGKGVSTYEITKRGKELLEVLRLRVKFLLSLK